MGEYMEEKAQVGFDYIQDLEHENATLTARVAELESALRPFAHAPVASKENWDRIPGDEIDPETHLVTHDVTVADFYAAAAALTPNTEDVPSSGRDTDAMSRTDYDKWRGYGRP